MLFNYLLDITPFVFAVSMPSPAPLPAAPSASVDAEKLRQDAADRALRDATVGGRSSTIRGGNDVAYARQAGRDLMSGGASRSMGM